jgi:hypothetical protein
VKRARKRTQIVGEILDTERSYVQGLHVIVGVRLLVLCSYVVCVWCACVCVLAWWCTDRAVRVGTGQVFLNPLRSAVSGPCPVIDTQSLTQVCSRACE